jgi:hypothetical protein
MLKQYHASVEFCLANHCIEIYLLLLQVLEADVPAASSTSVKAWRSEQHAHDSETEALLSFMQHHAVNLGVSCCYESAQQLYISK